jgi:hypothetical protein
MAKPEDQATLKSGGHQMLALQGQLLPPAQLSPEAPTSVPLTSPPKAEEKSGDKNTNHHHQPINVSTSGAQAFLMDYT